MTVDNVDNNPKLSDSPDGKKLPPEIHDATVADIGKGVNANASALAYEEEKPHDYDYVRGFALDKCKMVLSKAQVVVKRLLEMSDKCPEDLRIKFDSVIVVANKALPHYPVTAISPLVLHPEISEFLLALECIDAVMSHGVKITPGIHRDIENLLDTAQRQMINFGLRYGLR